MGDTFHEGDMSEELAEREYLSCTALELFDIAKRSIREKWLDRAVRCPESIREAYADMTGCEVQP